MFAGANKGLGLRTEILNDVLVQPVRNVTLIHVYTRFRISAREIHAKYGDEPVRLRCDSLLDSLNAVQAANEAPKVEDGARVLVTVGVDAP